LREVAELRASDVTQQVIRQRDDLLREVAQLRASVPTNTPPHMLSEPLPPISQLLPKSNAIIAIRASVGAWNSVQDHMLQQLNENELLAHVVADTSRIPAPVDREYYAGDDHLLYWLTGFADAIYINHLIKTYLGKDAQDDVAVFDLGCASGRALRHVGLTRASGRVLGSDINPNHIAFVRAYLPERVTPIHNVVFPPLPLPDQSIDFLYGLSVFTHISDFEEAWLCEIKRILRPEGVAFITVHTERTFADLRPGHFLHDVTVRARHSATGVGYHVPLIGAEFFRRDGFGDRLVLTHLDLRVNNTQVFHHTEYLRRRWGSLFAIEDIIQNAHGTHQDGIVLRA
jgi:SAM-dependent methyltransferase